MQSKVPSLLSLAGRRAAAAALGWCWSCVTLPTGISHLKMGTACIGIIGQPEISLSFVSLSFPAV